MVIERGGIRRLIKDSEYPKWAAKGFKKVEVEKTINQKEKGRK